MPNLIPNSNEGRIHFLQINVYLHRVQVSKLMIEQKYIDSFYQSIHKNCHANVLFPSP